MISRLPADGKDMIGILVDLRSSHNPTGFVEAVITCVLI
jgi:hypothetical protein